jgi:hypothetical protein
MGIYSVIPSQTSFEAKRGWQNAVGRLHCSSHVTTRSTVTCFNVLHTVVWQTLTSSSVSVSSPANSDLEHGEISRKFQCWHWLTTHSYLHEYIMFLMRLSLPINWVNNTDIILIKCESTPYGES